MSVCRDSMLGLIIIGMPLLCALKFYIYKHFFSSIITGKKILKKYRLALL